MKRSYTTLVLLFGLLLALIMPITTYAQTTHLQTDFIYQGYLKNVRGAVNATCNFQFSLFDAVAAGNQVGVTQTVNAVTVSNGAFSVQLDFGAGSFNGQDRFLQIAVQCPSQLVYTTLSPRQPILPAPYAGYALGVPWAGVTGVPAGFADDVDNEGWSLTGNAGTTPGTNFIGTTDNVALEFVVNSQRVLRIEPADDDNDSGNNLIGGYSGNTVATGVVGATVLGGAQSSDGSFTYPNRVFGSYGTVSGGRGNTATFFSTVGGGGDNTASGIVATIGGGEYNEASSRYATIGGGTRNEASGDFSTIGGGYTNVVTADYATIAGGGPSDPDNNRFTTNNVVYDNYGTIGGGGYNRAGSDDSDTTTQLYATVGGGGSNTASGQGATVGGGSSNTASGTLATLAGGSGNVAGGIAAMIGGGESNIASGIYATVAGGGNNEASGQYATVSGGSNNGASGLAATVAGGGSNTAAGDYSFVVGLRAQNTDAAHDGVFLFADTTAGNFNSNTANEFAARASGGVRFVVGSTTCTLSSGDTDWNCGATSGQEFKSNFQTIDPRMVLDQVMNMPVQTWSYNGTDTRHMGPVAEDFYAAFGLGSSDQKIEFVDANGVNLAAIQGLYEIVQEKDAQISELEARLNAIEQQNNTPLYGFVLVMSGVVAAGLYFGQHHRQRVE